jgi:hypothetical protein
MFVRLTTQYICDILQHEMDLTDDQIWIYNQKQNIPHTQGLFISVGQMGIVAYGVNRRPEGTTEKLSQMLQEIISIELYSNDTSALTSLSNVLGALSSTYSIKMQEEKGFKIGAVPTSINDTSFLEGTAILYRLSLTYKVLRAYEVQKDIEYFSTFTKDVKTEN